MEYYTYSFNIIHLSKYLLLNFYCRSIFVVQTFNNVYIMKKILLLFLLPVLFSFQSASTAQMILIR